MAHTIYKNKDKKRVPSVTTILSEINKPFLMIWANKLGLQGIDSTKYVDDKAMIGTLAHYLIESFCKKEKPNFTQFDCTDSQIEQAKACARKFLEWKAEHEFEPIENELQLVSEEFQYGGTIDCIAKVDGLITLIDFKTCASIHDEALWQTSAYKQMAEEHGYKIEKVIILRIGRDLNEGFEEKTNDLLEECFRVFLCALNLYRSKKEYEKTKKERANNG